MPISYVVEQGDCISSISRCYGFKPETIWNDSANAELKALRVDGNLLLPGDVLTIPDKRVKPFLGETDARHRFKLNSTRAYLRLQLLEEDDARANAHYTLEIDGVKLKSGSTDGEGKIDISIPADAQSGRLIMDEGDVIELQLGSLDPLDTPTGLQGRLLNLGFDCGAVDGDLGAQSQDALYQFQRKYGLEETGELDPATKAKLTDIHGDET